MAAAHEQSCSSPPAVPRGPFTGSHTLNVHAQRLKTEADAALLRNRLERLKQEELKALKKIADTRRRAEEITQLKQRNETRSLQRRGLMIQQQRQHEATRQRVEFQKVAMQGAAEASRERIASEKREMAAQTRRERKRIESAVQNQREHQFRHARQVYETVRDHHNQVMHTKMRERMLHEERLQAETERRMTVEEAKRRDAETLVHHMEANEEVLIERLRRTQEAQKLAYEELEHALSTIVPPRDPSARQQTTPALTTPAKSDAPTRHKTAPQAAPGHSCDPAWNNQMPQSTHMRAISQPGTPRSPGTFYMYKGPLAARVRKTR